MPDPINRVQENSYKFHVSFKSPKQQEAYKGQVVLTLNDVVVEDKQSLVERIALNAWKEKKIDVTAGVHGISLSRSEEDKTLVYVIDGAECRIKEENLPPKTKKVVTAAQMVKMPAIEVFQAQWTTRFEAIVDSILEVILGLIYSITKTLFNHPWVEQPLTAEQRLTLFEKMGRRFAHTGPQDFSHLMGVYAQTIQSSALSDAVKERLTALLKQGEKDGLRIQASLEDPAQVNQLGDALGLELCQGYEEASKVPECKERVLRIFDLGYTDAAGYHPVPIAFIYKKSDEGIESLHIRLTRLDTTEAEKEKYPPFIEYQIPDALSVSNLSNSTLKQKMTDLFKVLIPFRQRNDSVSEVKSATLNNSRLVDMAARVMRHEVLSNGSSPSKKTKVSSNEPFAQLHPHEMMEKILDVLGGKRVSLPAHLTTQVHKTSKDWAKQLLTTLAAAAPDAPLKKEDLLQFETSFLLSYATSVDNYITNQNPDQEEKRTLLLNVEKGLKKLEKKYAAEWRDEKAFGKVLSAESIPACLKELREKIEEVKQGIHSTKIDVLEQDSMKEMAWKVEVPLLNNALSDTKALQEAPAQKVLSTYSDSLQAFDAHFHALEHAKSIKERKGLAKTVVTDLKKWVAETEILFKEGKWQDCQRLLGTFFSLLPPPAVEGTIHMPAVHMSDSFVLLPPLPAVVGKMNIQASVFWALLDAAECDQVSEQLTHLAHHFWEAALRNNSMQEQQEHAFAFVNLQLVQHGLIRRKAQLILEKYQLSPSNSSLYPTPCDNLDNYNLAKLNGDEQATVALVLINATSDLSQATYVLQHHPLFRGGSQPLQDNKRLHCIEYVDAIKKSTVQPTPCVIDTARSLINLWSDSHRVDNNISQCLRSISQKYKNRFSERFEQFEIERPQPDSEGKVASTQMPLMWIDARRLSMFGQMLLHPDSTLHASFSLTGIRGDLERHDWLMKQFTRAATADPDSLDKDFMERVVMHSLAENNDAICNMQSPLLLAHHDTAAEASIHPCFVVKGSNFLSPKLEYEPTGIIVFDNRRPIHDFNNLGQEETFPKDFLKSAVSTADYAPPGHFNKYEGMERPRQQSTKEPLTEVTAWILENYDATLPSFDTELNAKLRTLEIMLAQHSSGEQSATVSVNTFYNVFDILLHRTDCLENETVVRIVEMALYRTGFIRHMIEHNEEYFNNNKIGERLCKSIETAIQRDHKVAASFLMHVSDMIKQQALIASNEALSSATPNYATVYHVDAKNPAVTMTGRSRLQSWVNSNNTDAKDRKYLDILLLETFLREIEVKMMQGMTKENALKAISLTDLTQICQAYYRIRLSSSDTGYPPLQREVEIVFEMDILPFIEKQILTQDAQRDDFLTRLWYLHETGKAELPAQIPEWHLQRPNVWANGGDITLNLLNGVVTENGETKGFETSLPKEILETNPHFKTILGKEIPIVEVYPVTGDCRVVDYCFMKNERKVLIRYDNITHEAMLTQEIPFKGRLINARYIPIKPGQALEGSAALMEQFGCWQEVDKELRGFLITHPDQDVGHHDKIHAVRFRKNEENNTYSIRCIYTAHGDMLVQDAKREINHLFGFADGTDTVIKMKESLFSSEISEVHFLSKHLHFKRHGEEWKTEGQLKGYQLQRFSPFAKKELGDDYHLFAAPVCKKDEATQVTDQKCLIWPVRLVTKGDQIEADTKSATSAKVPFLTIQVREGVVTADDQQVQGTSAAFLYAAYALMKQKQYDKAIVYLAKAQAAPLPSDEVEAYKLICSYIQQDTDMSKKGLAVKMKAEVVINKILKEQLGQEEYVAAEFKSHMDRIGRRIDLYEHYKKAVESDLGKSSRLDTLFYLSQEEKVFFELAVVESLKFLLIQAKEKPAVKELPAASEDKIKAGHGGFIPTDAMEKTGEMLLPYFKKPDEKRSPLADLHHNSVTKEWLLKNFTAIYHEILRDGIAADDFRALRLQCLRITDATADELPKFEILKQKLMQLNRDVSACRYRNIETPLERLREEKGLSDDDYELIRRALKYQHVTPSPYRMFIGKVVNFLIVEQLRRRDFITTSDVFREIFEGMGFYDDEVINRVVNQAKQLFIELTEGLHLKVFRETEDPIQPAQDSNDEEGQGFDSTLRIIEKQIEDMNSPFSSEERAFWTLGCELITREASSTNNSPDAKIDMAKVLAGALKYNINIIDLRHKAGKLHAIEKATPKEITPRVYPEVKWSEWSAKDEQWFDQFSKDYFSMNRRKPPAAEVAEWLADVKAHARTFNAFVKKAQKLEDVDPEEYDRTPEFYYLLTLRSLKEAGQAPIVFHQEHIVEECAAVEASVRQLAREKLQKHYETVAKNAKESYVNSNNPDLVDMEEREKVLRAKGIDEHVAEKMEEWEKRPGVVKQDDIPQIRTKLLEQISSHQGEAKKQRDEAMKLLDACKSSIPDVFKLIRQKPQVSDEDILNKALDLYQFGQLVPANKLVEGKKEPFLALEKALTLYLYEAAMVQQLQQACTQLEELSQYTKDVILAESVNEATMRAQRLKGVEQIWETYSSAFYHTLKEAHAFRSRYLTDDMTLKDAKYSRKFLVAQCRFGIVYRQEQIDTVRRLVEEKNLCVLRNPGFGKSKAIFPVVVGLLAEKGEFPVVLETGELFRIAEQDLDKFTRHIYNQARHIFHFHSSRNMTSAELVDEYQRLDTAKKSGGYVVTHIDALAALDNTLVRKTGELKKKIKTIAAQAKEKGFTNVVSDANNMGLMASFAETQKQRHWLMKIRGLLHSGYIVADEVDEIFNIVRWINEAIGMPDDIDQTLLTVIDRTFASICGIAEKTKHAGLSKLATTMLRNEQANLSPSQVKEALGFLADQIYDTKEPLGLSEKDWTQFKALLEGKGATKKDFVDYMLGVANASIKLVWKDMEDKTAFKAVSTLKHLCTTTLKTVLKEEVELDYGFTEDGCTVEPLKKGEKIPQTKHGDEYELTAYHFALYASAILSFDVFSSEWRRIQTEISGGVAPQEWKDFYIAAKVQDLPPREQVKALYDILQKEENWNLRFMLVKDIMQKRVKVFREQIKNNVQNILHGEDKKMCGASGTVNPDALPEEFVIDESCYSRKVSGAVDVSFAEMNEEMLNKHVTIFDDSKQNDAYASILKDASDYGVQAIINQGGVLRGQNSRQAVETIRAHLKKHDIERQIAFVDPKSRRIMMWDPHEPEPKKFDKDKLHPGYLSYFGPPDTRGTDLPIPVGRNEYYVSKTILEEYRVQSILRLRRFGRGHTATIHMHKSIQESINSKLGREADHAITYAELFNDIKVRTLEEQSQNNWKSALQRIRVMTTGALKEYLFAPQEIDEKSYWHIDFSNPGSELLRVFSDAAADVALFDVCEKEFIKTRQPEFESDFSPYETVDSIAELRLQYHEEVKKAQGYVDFAKKQAIKTATALLKSLMVGVPSDKCYLHQETNKRLVTAGKKMEKLPERIESREKALNEQRLRQSLRKTVPKTFNEKSSAQEQVQQQQQQQMNQQEQDNVRAGKILPPEYGKRWQDWRAVQTIRDPRFAFPPMHQTLSEIAGVQSDFGLDQTFQVSPNQADLMKGRRWMMGASMDRIAIWTKRDRIVVQAIDQQDFNLGFCPEIREAKENDQPLHSPVEVHSLGMHGLKDKGVPSDYLEGVGSSVLQLPKDAMYNEYMKKLAIMKMIHGHIFFTEEEFQALEPWLQQLKESEQDAWKQYICRIHRVARLKNMRGWENSPLKAILTD